ncbi:MAG TPA: flagellar basal body rod protein FlgB [Armatimonadota bacterium]|nr:flagellar basal body rod protein FlgB [Armatimonadota bacterium]HPP75100.1 flagellar basal body rod protein FlgB [Armatimonadota bacterium]
MSDFFSDITTLTLSKTLDGLALRHKVIANNIANAETPGFTRSEVRFEDKLRAALDGGTTGSAKKRISESEASVDVDSTSPTRPDGNNVSIDKEMAELTKNTLRYEALIHLLNLKGSMTRTAITEGRR